MLDTPVKSSSKVESHLCLWIEKDGHDLEGPYAIITCPECLRTFPQSLDAAGMSLVLRADCVHCQCPIEYALTELSSSWIHPPLQRKPNATALAPILGGVPPLPRYRPDDRPALAGRPFQQRLRPAG